MTGIATRPPCPVCGAEAALESAFGDAPLSRCPACRFVFLDLSEADAAALYGDEYFAAYAGGDYRAQEAQRRHESLVRLRWMEQWVAPPARLFEVGAAAGFFLDEARRRGFDVSGVELSESMAAHARDRLALEVGSEPIESVQLPAGAFDVVCAWHVVEHLPRPAAVIERLAEALAPGGRLFVEVPNIESALARHAGADWPALDLPHHVGHHGPESMRRLIERAGLETVVVETIPFAVYGRHPLPRAAAAVRVLAESLRVRRRLPTGPHPAAHQILRAVAARPAR